MGNTNWEGSTYRNVMHTNANERKGKKYDKDKKQYYYRYFDPGNYYKGTNENLRLYIGSDYSVSGVGGYNPNLTYKMSYVKKTVDLNK